MSFLGRLFAPPPLWDWLQVQITSACNAACLYCPRTADRSRWIDSFMPLAVFERIQPFFSRAGHVHLQGWGEPLLHPDFWEMARRVKAAGRSVGATTNGTLFVDDTPKRLVDEGFDLVAVSLAGVDKTQDHIRRGAPVEKVLQALAGLQQAKNKRRTNRPRVHLAYMMLRSRLEDVFRLPDLAAGLGVDQVVISTLDYVAEPGLKVETLDDLSLTEEKELDARLTELAKNARKRGLDITWRLPTLKTAPSPGCPENVGRALVISEEGGVRPCVFWNLPPSGEVKPEAVSRRAPDFGRLDRASLIEIWKAEDYRSFRAEWASGGIPAPCRGCPKPFRG